MEVLKIKNIIVCGHYGCGGVKAAMTNRTFGPIDNWLRHIKDIYRLHEKQIKKLTTEDAQLNRLIELNIIEQVNHLAATHVVQKAWKERSAPNIFGWVYDLHDGIIHPLIEMQAGSPLQHPIFEYRFGELT